MGLPYQDAIGLLETISSRLNPEVRAAGGESHLSRALSEAKRTGRGTMQMRAV